MGSGCSGVEQQCVVRVVPAGVGVCHVRGSCSWACRWGSFSFTPRRRRVQVPCLHDRCLLACSCPLGRVGWGGVLTGGCG